MCFLFCFRDGSTKTAWGTSLLEARWQIDLTDAYFLEYLDYYEVGGHRYYDGVPTDSTPI